MTKMQPKKGSAMTSKCSVCSGPSASHLHYGAVSCYSCGAFFRRGIGKPYCCVEGTGDCSVDWTSRRSCQWCRFDKIYHTKVPRICSKLFLHTQHLLETLGRKMFFFLKNNIYIL